MIAIVIIYILTVVVCVGVFCEIIAIWRKRCAALRLQVRDYKAALEKVERDFADIDLQNTCAQFNLRRAVQEAADLRAANTLLCKWKLDYICDASAHQAFFRRFHTFASNLIYQNLGKLDDFKSLRAEAEKFLKM